MSHKIPVTIQDSVADTLFIPLFMRHLETRRKDGIIDDPLATKLVQSIDYDFEKYKAVKMSQLGTAIRIRHFDRAVRRFVERTDNPVVVSVGAGLDTRFQRVHAGKGLFYELDLPEVIAFRETLLPSSKANPYISTSMFETDWMETLVARHPDATFAVVAEGVFMYFDKKQLKPMFQAIAQYFAGGELHFDACSRFGVKNSHRHETVKLTNASFRWALDDLNEPSQWAPGLRHSSTELFMNQERRRWGLSGFVMNMVPPLRTAFRMVQYDISLS